MAVKLCVANLTTSKHVSTVKTSESPSPAAKARCGNFHIYRIHETFYRVSSQDQAKAMSWQCQKAHVQFAEDGNFLLRKLHLRGNHWPSHGGRSFTSVLCLLNEKNRCVNFKVSFYSGADALRAHCPNRTDHCVEDVSELEYQGGEEAGLSTQAPFAGLSRLELQSEVVAIPRNLQLPQLQRRSY